MANKRNQQSHDEESHEQEEEDKEVEDSKEGHNQHGSQEHNSQEEEEQSSHNQGEAQSKSNHSKSNHSKSNHRKSNDSKRNEEHNLSRHSQGSSKKGGKSPQNKTSVTANKEIDLPEERIRECELVFKLFDRDGNGHITAEEIGDVMKRLGVVVTHGELKMFFDEIDKDGSGEIEFREFLLLFSDKLIGQNGEDDLLEAFRNIDEEGTGMVSAAELRDYMATHGDKITEEEADILIEDAEANLDGYIDYKEFSKYLLTQK